MQKVREEDDPQSRRVSADGQQKLHQEFEKLQSERKEKISTSDAGGAEQIDWGMCVLRYSSSPYLTLRQSRFLGRRNGWY